MLIVENNQVGEKLTKLKDKYKIHFNSEFPIYEHLDIAAEEGIYITEESIKKLSSFIDNRIRNNNPVPIPEGYFDRLY